MRISLSLPSINWEDAYYDVTRPFRRLWSPIEGYFRLTFFPNSLKRCERCNAIAQWSYLPAGHPAHYCDDCISRGCNCNRINLSTPRKIIADPPNADGDELIWEDFGDIEPEQHRDAKGRLLPCCEYSYKRWGWPKVYRRSFIDKFFEKRFEKNREKWEQSRSNIDWKAYVIANSEIADESTSGNRS